jgi:hypothetical protein
MGCSQGAPQRLTAGSACAVFGLLAYFVLLLTGFGLLWGGYVKTSPYMLDLCEWVGGGRG